MKLTYSRKLRTIYQAIEGGLLVGAGSVLFPPRQKRNLAIQKHENGRAGSVHADSGCLAPQCTACTPCPAFWKHCVHIGAAGSVTASTSTSQGLLNEHCRAEYFAAMPSPFHSLVKLKVAEAVQGDCRMPHSPLPPSRHKARPTSAAAEGSALALRTPGSILHEASIHRFSAPSHDPPMVGGTLPHHRCASTSCSYLLPRMISSKCAC